MKRKSLVKWMVVSVDNTEATPTISYVGCQTKELRDEHIENNKEEGIPFIVISKNFKKVVDYIETDITNEVDED
jgi:hypothetical protein